MADLEAEAQKLPEMSFALLPSLALRTFVFALSLGISCLVAYAFAFLFSFDRSKGGFQGPPPGGFVLIIAIFTVYFYFMCCTILYAYSDRSFDFYYVFGWGMAVYLIMVSVLFISLASLAVLWLYLRDRVDAAMWTLTDATRGEHQNGGKAAEGGVDTGKRHEDTNDNVPLLDRAEGEGGAGDSEDKTS